MYWSGRGGVYVQDVWLSTCGLYVWGCLYVCTGGSLGVDSPSSIESTPRAHGDTYQASHVIHSVMAV